MSQDITSAWEDAEAQTADEISIEDMDKLVVQYTEMRADYEAKKKVSTEAHKEMEKAKALVIQALIACKKSTYSVDGIGRVSKVAKEKITVPKTLDDKLKLFEYIASKHGAEFLTSMQSVNYNTLNSFYKEELESIEGPQKAEFVLPGVGAPTVEESLSFTKEKK